MTEPARRSVELFESGFYCAESVLLAFAKSRGIESDLLPAIATGFCSGIANSSGMCGAVSGAIMSLGLGRGRRAPSESVEPTYAAVQALLAQFADRFGSTNCLELCGCDLNTEAGQARFEATGQGERCARYVEQATRMALALAEAPPDHPA